MVKLTDPAPPPESQSLWDKFVSLIKPAPGQPAPARSKKNSTRILKSRSADKIRKELREAAEFVVNRFEFDRTKFAREEMAAEEFERLLAGTFKKEYWYEQTPGELLTFASPATNTPDLAPPPYKYRQPDLWPAVVEYGAGEEDSGGSSTTGNVSGGQWFDGTWRWTLRVFTMKPKYNPEKKEPLIWKSSGVASAMASARGSRPMWSLLLFASVWDKHHDGAADVAPPINPATSLYWRYLMPKLGFVPWSSAVGRSFVVRVDKRMKYEQLADLNQCVIKVGARPMRGRGFNNNDAVTSSWSETARALYRPHPFEDYRMSFGLIPRPAASKTFEIQNEDTEYSVDYQFTEYPELGVGSGEMICTVNIGPTSAGYYYFYLENRGGYGESITEIAMPTGIGRFYAKKKKFVFEQYRYEGISYETIPAESVKLWRTTINDDGSVLEEEIGPGIELKALWFILNISLVGLSSITP